MKFKIEKVANMIFITNNYDTIFKAWNIEEFTERKLKNAITKIKDDYCGNVEFERMFWTNTTFFYLLVAIFAN